MTLPDDLLLRFLADLQGRDPGEAHAVTAAQLTRALGLPTTESGKRIVRALAQRAVADGHLVCSTDAGYFLPASPQEVAASVARLRSGASELWARANRASELAVAYFDLQDEPEPEGERPGLFALMEVGL